jgi:hypothetical protein
MRCSRTHQKAYVLRDTEKGWANSLAVLNVNDMRSEEQMASRESIRDLNADEQGFFDFWRTQLRLTLPEQERHIVDTTTGKLKVIQLALDHATAENRELLQGLGVLFGDALAAELGLKWVMMTDQFGIGPVVIRPGTSFKIGAFSAIEKRVVNGEVPVQVGALFDAFCDSANQILLPKKPFWGRLFGPRVV